MSAVTDKLETKANAIRGALAKAEAEVARYRAELAKVEAKLSGEPPPQTGLDLLWKAALPIARTRSSKVQCRTEWMRIPAGERPMVKDALAALVSWNRCEEWKKDGNAFVPALHRWIKNRQWENVPESSRRDPFAKYRQPAREIQQPTDAVTDRAEIAKLLSLSLQPNQANQE